MQCNGETTAPTFCLLQEARSRQAADSVALFSGIPPPPAGVPPSESAVLAPPPAPPGPPPPAAFPSPASLAILQRWLLHSTHAPQPTGPPPMRAFGATNRVDAPVGALPDQHAPLQPAAPVPAQQLAPDAPWLQEGEYIVDGVVYMDGSSALLAGLLVQGVQVQVAQEAGGDSSPWQAGLLQAVQEFKVPHTELTLTKVIVQSPPDSKHGVAFAPEDVRAVLGPAQQVQEARANPPAHSAQSDAAPASEGGGAPAPGGGVDAFFSGDGWSTVQAEVLEKEEAAAQEAATAAHLKSLSRYAAGDEDAVAPPVSAEPASAAQTAAVAARAAADEDLHAYGAVDALAAFNPMGSAASYKGVALQPEAGPPVPAAAAGETPASAGAAQAVFKKRVVTRKGKRKRA